MPKPAAPALNSSFLTSLGLPIPIDPATVRITSHGSSGFSSAYKVTANLVQNATETNTPVTTTDNTSAPTILFFMKTASSKNAEIMFRGEYESLKAISTIAPGSCPKPYAFGKLLDQEDRFFLFTDFLEFGKTSHPPPIFSEESSLVAKLAKLHTTEYIPPQNEPHKLFGFPVPTCCGNTVQPNTWSSTWSSFFSNNRLLSILSSCEASNGSDPELRLWVENKTVKFVVKRLLCKDGFDEKIKPVCLHGDLWSGNKGYGMFKTWRENEQKLVEVCGDVVFDPSSCYGHSEFDLGIMNMFGGFGREFWKRYHELVPKMEPVAEFEDRVRLYELYHHLNHYAIFGGSYRAGAMQIMKELYRKYGTE